MKPPSDSRPDEGDERAQPEVAAGDEAYARGCYEEALEHYLRASRFRPFVAEYHFKAAMTAWRAGSASTAEEHFQHAASLAPREPALHDGLAQWHLASGRIALALDHSATALTLCPGQASFVATRADVLARGGRYQEAWDLLAPLIDAGNVSGKGAWVCAQIAPRLGQERRALEVVGQALRSPHPPVGLRSSLHFASVALLDGLGECDAAFEQAVLANRLGRRPFNPAAHSAWVSKQIEYFTADRTRRLPRSSRTDQRPVFIIGMPRSGSSLVEQILASHPRAFGAGELGLFGDVVRLMAQAHDALAWPVPTYLELMSGAEMDRFAAQYVDGIAALDAGAAYVLDKMLLNFRVLGLIELLLPGSRIVHCRRDPRDACLSCYFTDFALGNDFSFDLSHLASYYRDYERLMNHWRLVLTIPMLEVEYEEVVADMEGQTRRMLTFLDLPWDPACLEFHQNRRYVATASREQVHRPIYSSSIGKWKKYQRHIPQLLELVG